MRCRHQLSSCPETEGHINAPEPSLTRTAELILQGNNSPSTSSWMEVLDVSSSWEMSPISTAVPEKVSVKIITHRIYEHPHSMLCKKQNKIKCNIIKKTYWNLNKCTRAPSWRRFNLIVGLLVLEKKRLTNWLILWKKKIKKVVFNFQFNPRNVYGNL